MAKQQQQKKKKGWILCTPGENCPSFVIKVGGHLDFTIELVDPSKVRDSPKERQKVTVVFEEKEVIEVL